MNINYKREAAELKAFCTKHQAEVNQLRGWQQRQTKLNTQTLLAIVVLGWHKAPQASLQELACWADELGYEVTPQALHARLNNRAVMHLYLLIQQALVSLASGGQLPSELLKHWQQVYLIDSTQIRLPEALREWFPGCQKHNAQFKTHLCLDYLSGQVQAVDVVAGKSPDPNSDLPVQMVQAHALVLFDLGYFRLTQVAGIHQQGAFFITPLQSQVAFYERHTGRRLTLAQLLKRRRKAFTYDVYLGTQEQLPVRILARRRSPEQTQHLRQEALYKAHAAGKRLSADYLERLAWDVLVTNLPTTPPATVWVLYGLRWQIEMIFKLWKTHLHLDDLGKCRPARVLCQWFALLLGAILFHWLIAPARNAADFELSLPRAYTLCKTRYQALVHALHASLAQLAIGFHTTMTKLRRLSACDARLKRPSSRQRLLALDPP